MNSSFLDVVNSKVEKDIILYESELTLKGTLTTKKMNSLIHIHGPEMSKSILKALTFLVMRSSKSESIYKEIEDDVAFSLAVDLFNIFQYESLQDVALLFKFARTGKLKLDPMSKKKSFYEKVLQDYAPAYLELKCELREDNHIETKKTFKPDSWTPENRKKLKELIKEIEPKKKPQAEFKERDNSMYNQDRFIEELKENVKITSKEKLQDFIDKWSKNNAMKRYVYILEDEIKSRQNNKTF